MKNYSTSLEPFPIIPRPAEIEPGTGWFVLTPDTVICADESNRWNAAYLQDLLSPPTGFPLPIQPDEPARTNAILLMRGGEGEKVGREGYRLAVSPAAVQIEAPQAAGVFYGIQTLRQLLPVVVERRAIVPSMDWQFPCVTIRDWPRFEWRGYMLDEGRHFHGKQTVLRTLDLMSLQKLNMLHWHLTEDQGWRVEIERYPRLTEVGSQRKGTARGFMGEHDGVPHGGFYSQEEIKEIVAYAAKHHITIVPEIEMPGHSLAALAAYPELSCTGGPFEVACRFGIMEDIYCAGKEETFTFLQNVLDEVMALFPSPFIHIGGDEAPKKRWKECPACQRRIRQGGLKDEHALQVYFTNRIAKYLASHGRRLVGWNEILAQGLDASAVAQYWMRNRKAFIKAIRDGRQAVISSYLYAYLDHSYSLTPLSKAYHFEPIFRELDARAARNVLGLEALMWTEFVSTRARLDYQTYPRLTAFAETGWTPKEKKDFKDFQQRLAVFMRRLNEFGVGYARGREVEPGWLRQLFGIFTIPQPQTRTAA
jgi:hexosaminidase